MVAQLYKYTKIRWIVHSEWMHFIMGKVYLNKAVLRKANNAR